MQGETISHKKANQKFQQDDKHARNDYYEQDDGQDLMSLLETYFLHAVGFLPDTFSGFCSELSHFLHRSE